MQLKVQLKIQLHIQLHIQLKIHVYVAHNNNTEHSYTQHNVDVELADNMSIRLYYVYTRLLFAVGRYMVCLCIWRCLIHHMRQIEWRGPLLADEFGGEKRTCFGVASWPPSGTLSSRLVPLLLPSSYDVTFPGRTLEPT